MKWSGFMAWYRRPVPRLLLRAAICTVLFCVAHLLGFRQYTSLVSGTVPLNYTCRLCGVTYIIMYAGIVLVAPICLIAAAILAAMERVAARRNG